VQGPLQVLPVGPLCLSQEMRRVPLRALSQLLLAAWRSLRLAGSLLTPLSRPSHGSLRIHRVSM
jgi:hypothetical protein